MLRRIPPRHTLPFGDTQASLPERKAPLISRASKSCFYTSMWRWKRHWAIRNWPLTTWSHVIFVFHILNGKIGVGFVLSNQLAVSSPKCPPVHTLRAFNSNSERVFIHAYHVCVCLMMSVPECSD